MRIDQGAVDLQKLSAVLPVLRLFSIVYSTRYIVFGLLRLFPLLLPLLMVWGVRARANAC